MVEQQEIVSGNIEKCTNNGIIEGEGIYAGGIVGAVINSLSKIIDCKNDGTVSGYESVGGITGFISNTNSSLIKCTNSGSVTGKQKVGGIIGVTYGTISECINNGSISSEQKVGGIVGAAYDNFCGTINKCINSGSVTGKKLGIGGIIGVTYNGFSGKINNNYNLGKIVVDEDNVKWIGGILGYVEQYQTTSGEIKYNYNLGQIQVKGTGVTYIGGVIGYINTKAVKRNNNYYLSGISNFAFGNNEGEEKGSNDMKTSEFLAKLNEGQNPAVWEYRDGVNNGYPVFIKTEE